MFRKVATCSAVATTAAWFTWPEYEEGLEKRRKVVLQIQNQFVRDRNEQLHQAKTQLSPEDYYERRRHFRDKPFEGSGHLFDLRQGRQAYLERNGCVKINNEAVQAIKRLSLPVVEIGAGLGQWALALSQNGVQVTAIDNKQDLPLVYAPAVFPVQEGDCKLLPNFPNHALLLVCPTGSLAVEAVQHFPGSTVVYVGEGRRGYHATKQFFDKMEREYDLVDTVTNLPVFDEYSFEQLWVFRKKR